MAMRVQWFAVALGTLFVLVACEESKVPPAKASAPVGRTAGRGGSDTATAGRGGSSRKPAAGPSTGSGDLDGGRYENDGDAVDAGTGDDSNHDDAGSALADFGPVQSWTGTTSQGLVISFDVAEAGLTQIRIEYASFGCDGDNAPMFDPPLPLGPRFSVEFALAGATRVTFAGSFSGDDSASGTLNFMSTPTPGQPSCGAGILGWTATRDSVP